MDERTWEQKQDDAAYEQWRAEEDWKKHDHQDHEANAAYYDQIAQDHAAQEQATNAAVQRVLNRVKTSLNELPVDHLRLAREQMTAYENRINSDRRFSDIVDRQVYEDRAYKQAMMHLAYAQAEQLKDIADALKKRNSDDLIPGYKEPNW